MAVDLPARRNPVSVAALALLAFLLAAPAGSRAATLPDEYASGEVLIKFAPGTSAAASDSILAALGATRLSAFRSIGASHQRISRMSVEQAVARFGRDPRVLYIEPNFIVHATAIPDDPRFAEQWGLHNTGQIGGTPGADIHAPEAWDVTTGNGSILVAILDTGVSNHSDLTANQWSNPREIPGNLVDDDGNGFVDDVHGWDFVRSFGPDPTIDDNGHGTHVAGIVGAIGNNGVGIAGVAWHVKLMAVKILDSNGAGTLANAIQGIEYATRMGARVMNNSWGGGPYSRALSDAIRAAGEAGVVMVFAAGNSAADNDRTPFYPASYDLPNIIAVAASDSSDALANFSNFGATTVDLAAPGTRILSTWRLGGYVVLSGTSMAAPMVAGAAALMLSRFPNMDPPSVRDVLMRGVDPVPALAAKVASGGRLDLARALANPDISPPDPVTDLATTHADGQWVELQWTATGDDGALGRAERYELRYSKAPITPGNFASATLVRGTGAPLPAGSIEHARVPGLEFSTSYQIAVIARDEYGNASTLSNVVSVTTLGPPLAGLTSASLDASVFTGGTATRSLTITNTGASELDYRLTATPRALPAAVASRWIAPAGARSEPPPGTTARAIQRYDPGGAGEYPARALAPSPRIQAQTTRGYRVLMLTSAGQPGEMRDQLLTFPDLVQVDIMDVSRGLPTLKQLEYYQAVVLSNGSTFPDPYGLGDVLADYADWGGGVILTLASFVQSWELRGRFVSGGYMPFAISPPAGGSAVLGDFDSLHPIMNGVTSLSGNLLGAAVLTPGAQWVASWIGDRPLVATQGPHVVGINLYIDQPGHWIGDAPLLFHNAIVWAGAPSPFLSFEPESGLVVPGASADVQVTLDAARLYGGDYASDVVMHSNDPIDPELTLGSTLHVTGSARIALIPDHLDFRQVFVGYSDAETVRVVNLGVEPLNVSSVTSDVPDVHASRSAFILAPGDTMVVLATYAPTAPATVAGSLTFASNDPDQPARGVALSGFSLPAPAVAVSPAALAAELRVGETSGASFDIANPGGSDLTFTVGWRPDFSTGAAFQPSRALIASSGRVSRIGATPDSASAAAPPATLPTASRANAVAATTTSGAPSGILVLATTDVSLSLEPALRSLGLAYDLVTTEDFTTVDFSPYRTVIVAMDGGSIEESDCLALANAARAGRLLFMVGGSVYAPYYHGLQQYLLSNGGVFGWRVTSFPQLILTNPSDPLARGLPTTYGFANLAAGYYMLGINDTAAVMAARNGDGLPILIHKTLGAGTLVYYTASPSSRFWYQPADSVVLHQIVSNAFQFEAPHWFSASPRSGTVAAGARQTVNVGFDAGGLIGGTYRLVVGVSSNAPDRPTADVPVTMHLTGVPRIEVAPASLAFGSLFVAAAKSETVLVRNSGTDRLTVGSVSATPGDYVAGVGSLSLAPGETRAVPVTFSPRGVGALPGTLELTSNDPASPLVVVTLDGEGLPAPLIAVSPSSFTFSVPSGDSEAAVLNIDNRGGGPLQFVIGTRAPVSVAAAGAGAAVVAVRAGAAGARPVVATRASVTPVVASQRAGSVLVMSDGGTEGDVAGLLTAAGYSVTIGPDDADWNGTNPAPDDFAAVVLLDGPAFGSDMPDSGQAALVRYVSAGGGLVITEWVLYEAEQGRYATLRPLIPMRSVSTNVGPFQYRVVKAHPVTAGVSPTFTVESGLTGGHALRGSELVTLPDGEAVVVASDFALGHVVEFGMAGNWGGYRPLAQPDMQRLMANAVGWVGAGGWLTAVPASGTVPAGASQPVRLMAAPGRLHDGDYPLELAISSDDPLHATTVVPALLHVAGVPALAISATRLDFGIVQLTTAASETLTISNHGSAALVVDSVSVSTADFSAPSAGFTIGVGGSSRLPVTFAPRQEGAAAGVLEIHSNDPDQPALPIALAGSGVAPSLLAVAPDSLGASLLSGERAGRSLVIRNVGGSDAHFAIGTASAFASGLGATFSRATPATPSGSGVSPAVRGGRAQTAAALANTFGYRWLDSGRHGGPRFDWVEISDVGEAVPQSGEEWNSGPVPIGFPFPFYGQFFDSVRICSNGWLSFTSGSVQFSHLPLPTPFAPENLLAPFMADLFAPPASVFHSSDGQRLIIEYRNVHYSGVATPLTFEVVLDRAGEILFQYLDMGGSPSVATVGIQNGARGDALQISFDTALVRDSLAIAIAAGPRWLSASPVSGTLAPGGEQQVDVRLDPARLGGGDYTGQLVISNDDPAGIPHVVPVGIHVTDAPALDVSAEALDFGPVHVGRSRAETLVVVSDGSQPLIVSSLESRPASFRVPGAGFTLAPGDSMPLVVTFQATGLGAAQGSLTLHSTDPLTPDRVIPLHGEGVAPPEAALEPSLLEDVLGPAEVHDWEMTLSNRGGTPLIWRAASFSLSAQAPDTVVAQPALGDALARLDDGASFVTTPLAGGFDFSDGSSGSSIADGGQGMFQSGNQLGTDLGADMPYTDGAIVNSASYGARYVTRKYPGLFVLGLDAIGAQAFRVGGGLGAAGAGSADQSLVRLRFLGTDYIGLVKRVYGAAVPSVNHLIILADPGPYTHDTATDTRLDDDRVTGLLPGGRLYYLLFAGEAGVYYTDAEIGRVMARFLNLIYSVPTWVSVSPASGSVPPMSGVTLTASLDSRRLATGAYLGSLLLETNQPDQPLLSLPVSVTVTDAATIDDAVLIAATPIPGQVHLSWQLAAGSRAGVRLEKSSSVGLWVDVGPLFPDGQGQVNVVDSDVTAGASYGYRLAVPKAGGVRYMGEARVTVPRREAFALLGATPNPARTDLNVAFSLPDDQPASLELLDLAGRRLRSAPVGTLGAGRHVASLGNATGLPSGLYLIRLEHAGQKLVAKCVVVR